MSALLNVYPTFGDPELLSGAGNDDASVHAIWLEFSAFFDASASEERQLIGLAAILDQCVRATDSLENAAGTCFLEHLGQIDRNGVLWKVLTPEVKAYVRGN